MSLNLNKQGCVSNDDAISRVEAAEKQTLKIAKDFSRLNKENKSQERALRIANFQLPHYVKQLEDNLETINDAFLGTLRCLALTADYKDENTGEHIIRMSRYTAYLSFCCGYSFDEARNILFGAPMHDIGKVGIPDAILNKPGRLTEDERKVIQTHPVIGADILKGSNSELIQMAEKIAISHHERWDGKGYPYGLKATDIPMVGRIAAVADVFDALTIKRPYKKPFSDDAAIDLILKEKERAFDPDVVDVFIKEIDSFIKIKRSIDSAEGDLSKSKLLAKSETEFLDQMETGIFS
ncbi:MAG: HD domain-containing protein [Nitrospinae bacterium]|nr:HD domain-containing protein [Nitrospinota bacterium]